MVKVNKNAQWLKISKKVAFPKNHQNWPFLGIFNQLLPTQNVSVAQNVEWDFFCDFQPLCRIFAHCAVHKNVRQRPKAWEASRQVLHQSSNAFWGTLFTHGHSKKVEPPTDHPWIEPKSHTFSTDFSESHISSISTHCLKKPEKVS